MGDYMMPDFQPLTAFLQNHLTPNLARAKCLHAFIVALIQTKSINLVMLSNAFMSTALCESSYKRLKRFLCEIVFDPRSFAQTIADIMELERSEKWSLAFDRTNWKFGKLHINILYLAVCYKGMSVPLFWSLLEDKKRGNSDFIDRADLIDMFIDVFGVRQIGAVLGDREFIGKSWIEYFQKRRIPFAFRLKENGQLIVDHRGRKVKISRMLRFLNPKQSTSLGIRKIGLEELTAPVSALRTEKGELVVLVHSQEIKDPLSIYRDRWQIETMFKSLKSNGFNLEGTHITDPDRLMMLFNVVAIAFACVYRQGVIRVIQFPRLLKRKKHGYFAKSIFRIGADHMQHLLLNMNQFKGEIVKIFTRTIRPETLVVQGISSVL
jgi:hypothetical protein